MNTTHHSPHRINAASHTATLPWAGCKGGDTGQKGPFIMAKRITTDCEGFHRRDFLKFGTGAGLFGLGLPQLLKLEAQAKKEDIAKRKADAVIMVWLAGGPSTIDMWDLKPEAPEGIRGEFKPIE